MIRLALLPLLAAGCAVPQPERCAGLAPGRDVVWLLDKGWHTEIGLPADEVSGKLAVFRDIFPGARVLMFGFGKRTWMTAKVRSPAELLIGPLPGPGTVQVVGLRVSPERAYGRAVAVLTLPPGGADRLSAFLWESIGKGIDGGPRLIAPGHFPGSLFYAATRRYNLTYTCNTWTADALAAAGLPVSTEGVILAGGVLRQTARLRDACLLPAAGQG